jgi:hypothetical protein
VVFYNPLRSSLRDHKIGSLKRRQLTQPLRSAGASFGNEVLLEAVFRKGGDDLAGSPVAIDREASQGGSPRIGDGTRVIKCPGGSEGGPSARSHPGPPGRQKGKERDGFARGKIAEDGAGLQFRAAGPESETDAQRAASLIHPVIDTLQEPVVPFREGLPLGKDLRGGDVFGKLRRQIQGKGPALVFDEFLKLPPAPIDMEHVIGSDELPDIDLQGEGWGRRSLGVDVADAHGSATGKQGGKDQQKKP